MLNENKTKTNPRHLKIKQINKKKQIRVKLLPKAEAVDIFSLKR